MLYSEILILGNGYLASSITRQLISKGHKITVYARQSRFSDLELANMGVKFLYPNQVSNYWDIANLPFGDFDTIIS